jgi:hypothetical protein
VHGRHLAFFVAIAVSASSSAQIAFARHHFLYVLPCDRRGLPTEGAKPVRVCAVPLESEGGEKQIVWTPSGEIAFLPNDEPHVHPSTIQLVAAKAGARPRIMAKGFDAAFSSDSRHVLYAVPKGVNSDLWMLDLRTGTKSLYEPGATEPVWSDDSKRIAYAEVSRGFGASVAVREFPSKKLVRRLPPAVNPFG